MTVETTVKERPILFSGPMVRAILDGRKTQTRRIVKTQPPEGGSVMPCYWCKTGWSFGDGDQRGCECHPVKCPYGWPGDRLWVRETWCECDGELFYRATYDTECQDKGGVPWRPSIFMPRIACRIKLEITDIRAERLKAITEEDAGREGFVQTDIGSPRDGFQWLWVEINGKDSWAANPWVWVINFKRINQQEQDAP